MKRLILMIQFLTRIPMPFHLDVKTEDFERGVIYFPVIGMILGVCLYGFASFFTGYFDPLTLAVLLVFLEVLLTGGLHLDGLADSFDGLFSYRDKERMLEIMKDSRIGSNGVLVLIFNLLLKTALIHQLLILGHFKALLWFPVLARAMSVCAARFTPYARESGMGNFFIGKVTNLQMFINLGFSTAWLLLFQPRVLWIYLPLALGTYGFSRVCLSKIDGMTGDTLGANTELMELLCLIIAVVILTGGGSLCEWFY